MRMMKLQKLAPTSKSPPPDGYSHQRMSLGIQLGPPSLPPNNHTNQTKKTVELGSRGGRSSNFTIDKKPNPPYSLSPPSHTQLNSTQLNSTKSKPAEKLTPSATYHHHSCSSDIGQACTREQRRNPRVGSETHSLLKLSPWLL